MPDTRGPAKAPRAKLPRDVLVLGVIAFFVMVGFGVVVPVLPVYAESFGVGSFEVGAVISAFALMRFVMSPFVARLIDWSGERTVLAVGIGIVAVSSGLAGLAQDYVQLLLLRGAGGIGSAMFSVAAMTLLLGSTDPTRRARAIGFYQGGFLIGGMAGPALGAVLATISLTAPFFFYAATLAVASVIGLLLLRPRTRDVAATGADEVVIPFGRVLRDPRYRAALLANLGNGWASMGVRSALIPLLVVAVIGADPSATGIAFACAAVVQALALAPAARFVDTRGRRPAIVGAYGVARAADDRDPVRARHGRAHRAALRVRRGGLVHGHRPGGRGRRRRGCPQRTARRRVLDGVGPRGHRRPARRRLPRGRVLVPGRLRDGRRAAARRVRVRVAADAAGRARGGARRELIRSPRPPSTAGSAAGASVLGRHAQDPPRAVRILDTVTTPPKKPLPLEHDSTRDGTRDAVEPALRSDVSHLGGLLGQVLRESGGDDLLRDVERLRELVIDAYESARDASIDDAERLVATFTPERAEQVARAFTCYFHLANLAEEHHRVRVLREREAAAGFVPDSIPDAVGKLTEELGREEAMRRLGEMRFHPVLTAHPTEARRRAVATGIRRIGDLLTERDGAMAGTLTGQDVDRRLLEEIDGLWRTSPLRTTRPTPLDEVRTAMSVFDQTLFEVVPRVYRLLVDWLLGDEAGVRDAVAPAFFRLGNWIAADRDGNPYVTAAVTEEAAGIASEHILLGLERVALRVGRSLTLGDADTPPSPELRELAAAQDALAPHLTARIGTRAPAELHRRVLLVIAGRLSATRERHDDPIAYPSAAELLADLRVLQASLRSAGAHRIAGG